ncbi:DUF305 domain-containing protein [Kocuria sp. CPCC 205231]|uniref:DUF305 domain-containing protein n=1 Tax=Kocuria sp. CPCC 205231 TaxID=3073551 RepID=UPI0034D5A815
MIPHHQAGPSMVAAILGCTEDPTVTFLAQSILISQQPEIQYREKLLATPTDPRATQMPRTGR